MDYFTVGDGCEVYGPAKDGEIEIDVENRRYVWLTKADVEALLRRFDEEL